MYHHDHAAHLVLNSTSGQAGMEDLHDVNMGHPDHANVNHHMDHGSMNHEHGSQGMIGSTGACSSSHAAHGMMVSFDTSEFKILFFKF